MGSLNWVVAPGTEGGDLEVGGAVVTGTIFDLMRFAVHDGPGIRTTVFLKGCPLRCQWCHNPESQEPGPELLLRKDLCVGCGECARACPTGAAAARARRPGTGSANDAGDAACPGPATSTEDRPACRNCGMCAGVCPSTAREMVGRTASADEVLAEMERDLVFYDQSGGGVTISGGEPLAQVEFLGELLDLSRRRGLRTCVDTSGFGPWTELWSITPLVDTFLYDLKLLDDSAHRRYTGASNGLILENLRQLAGRHDRVVVRIPVVPEVNDGEVNLASTGEFLSRLRSRPPVRLLPYHKAGIEKYRRLGRQYPLQDTPTPPAARMEEIAGRLRAFGLEVKVGA